MRNSSCSFKAVVTLALGAVMSVSCLAAEKPSDKTERAVPGFPYTQGWMGADDAYSIPLDSKRSIWLFGDSFVGDADATLRTKAKTMVRNSVGISTCEGGKPCTIKYYWKNPEAPKPRSFFDTGRDDVWYWPLDGYRDGNTLYAGMMTVRNKKGAGPEDPFGFEIAGTQWYVIRNVMDAPDKWKLESRELTGEGLWPGASTFADGDYLYFYTQRSLADGKGYMIVMRVSKKKLADPAKDLEYYANDKTWKKGVPTDDAMKVIDQAISEMSVRYHPSVKKWVAISGGKEWPTKRIVVRLADSLVGPWSEPQTVFEFPEMDPKNPIYDKDTFCYATKEHVEFGDAKLVISYACNSMVVQKVIDQMELYRPKIITVDIPKQ